MKKLLTISIPTWNRAELLNELLGQLIVQIQHFSLENLIEVLISDNNSDDNSWKIISTFQTKYSFISCNRNSINTGAKSNVLKSMELASSEFVMFLGDDDRIRKDCLPEILNILKSYPDIGIFIDTSKYRFKNQLKTGYQVNTTFYENLYWYMGNAGFFICRTEFIKTQLYKYGYAFFNECWPQTQIMILGLTNSDKKPYIKDILIPVESKHDQMMVYSSFYLWRTCVYDLFVSINDIKSLIPESIFNSCRKQMKYGIKQNFLNILQCGVFVDDDNIKKKTRNDIKNKIGKFSLKERIYLSIIFVVLSLPESFAKAMSNIFIWITKGKSGLNKKNEFVKRELEKSPHKTEKSKQIRSLQFEKE